MRGRRPTPTAIKKLRDNPGRRPLNDDEPKHPDLDPTCPRELVGAARGEWRRVVALLAAGHVTTVERPALMAYCQKYGQWIRFEQLAAKRPLIVSPSGYQIQHPAIAMANKALAFMLRAAAELGLTPAARSRIVLAAHEQPENNVDEFTAYQRRRLGRK